MRTWDSHVLVGTTPTSTGTKDFTVSGAGGTPIGAIVQAVRVTALDTNAANISSSWGVTDGTNEHSVSNYSADGLTTSLCRERRSTSLITLRDLTAGGAAIVEGVFSSFISNGIRINFTTVDASNAWYLMITLIFGTGTECAAFQSVGPTSGTTPLTVNVGFEPSFVLTADANDNTSAAARNTRLLYGAAVNDGSDTNRMAGEASRDNASTTSTIQIHRQDLVTFNVGIPLSDVNAGRTKIGNYTSTGFDITHTGTASAGRGIIGLAVKLPSGVSAELLADQTFATATGDDVKTTTVRPSLLYGLQSAAGGANTQATPGFVGLGVCDGRLQQYCVCWMDRNGVSTTEAHSRLSQSFHHLVDPTLSDLQVASVSGVGATSLTLDVTTAPGLGRYYDILVVEEVPFAGTGAGSFPLATGSGVGEEVFEGSGAGSFPLLTGTGTGTLEITGTGAGSFPPLTGTGLGELTFTGSGAGSFPLLTGTGTGELIFTGSGAGVFALAEALATGELIFEGTGAGTFPLLTGTGTGSYSFTGSGAGTFPLLTGTGAGLLVFTGSGAGTFPLLTGTGVGATDLVYEGTGAGTFPLLTGTGVGELVFEGTSAGVFALAEALATGELTFTGTGAGSFPLATATGAGLLVFEGSGAGSFPPLTGTGTGTTELVFEGTSAGVFALAEALATGELIFTGSGAGVFALAEATGFGINGESLACVSALLGSYVPVGSLLGSYVSGEALSGSAVASSPLLGRRALSEALLGGYDPVTSLEGGTC